jgi:hypothetical protein
MAHDDGLEPPVLPWESPGRKAAGAVSLRHRSRALRTGGNIGRLPLDARIVACERRPVVTDTITEPEASGDHDQRVATRALLAGGDCLSERAS